MRKIAVIVLSALCLCFTSISCYPELSVQQYDKLKEDLAALNQQSDALESELARVNTELATIKERNTRVRAYVGFLVQLISTQNSESLLAGEFDVNALVTAKSELMTSAEALNDPDIVYFLSIVNAEKEAETVGAYYKAIEYCIKNIKQQLNTNGTNVP